MDTDTCADCVGTISDATQTSWTEDPEVMERLLKILYESDLARGPGQIETPSSSPWVFPTI